MFNIVNSAHMKLYTGLGWITALIVNCVFGPQGRSMLISSSEIPLGSIWPLINNSKLQNSSPIMHQASSEGLMLSRPKYATIVTYVHKCILNYLECVRSGCFRWIPLGLAK